MKIGERLGKYRVVRPLGPALWLADRVEDFEQQETVALIPLATELEALEDYRERARKAGAINHPVIPRLLDSGQTAAHVPYVLFEFVPDEPAIAWARAHNLTLPQRIAFVLEYLDALALAHRNLVAYGSLTEESFRITSAGRPRLEPLPFADMSVDPAADDLSAVARFIAGLLTNGRSRSLPRDLRAILQKANDSSPYESIQALAADLRNYLDHRPVTARRPTPFYAAALLARRRPEVFYPAALAVAAVITATGYSLYMDSAAQRSRVQAQQRLHELQRLTYSLESDLYRPVSALPKSESAKATLIDWTAQSLDRLAAEAGNDVELRTQLARSYGRLAEVQRANGDAAAAQLSEDRARTVVAYVH